MEYVSQIFAISVYNCNFPIILRTAILSVILVEALYVFIDTVWTIKHGISVSRRNNKVMIDVLLEVLSASVPLFIMRFAYELPFSQIEFIQLAIVPAIFSLVKLYEIVDAIIRERAFIYAKRYKEKAFKLRRLSFFNSLKRTMKFTN